MNGTKDDRPLISHTSVTNPLTLNHTLILFRGVERLFVISSTTKYYRSVTRIDTQPAETKFEDQTSSLLMRTVCGTPAISARRILNLH